MNDHDSYEQPSWFQSLTAERFRLMEERNALLTERLAVLTSEVERLKAGSDAAAPPRTPPAPSSSPSPVPVPAPAAAAAAAGPSSGGATTRRMARGA